MAIKRKKNGLKKIMFLNVIFLLSVLCAYSQNGDQKGGRFIKRIEYNRHSMGFDNLDCKTGNEKNLLGKFNAPVEFYFLPLNEKPERPSAFRLLWESPTNSYFIEYIRFKSAETNDINDETVSRSFKVSTQFAEKMYKKMVSFIENIKARGTQKTINRGYEVTFRAVVDDEVWSLIIQEPSGDALKMSSLCRQILVDANRNKLDEAKYIKILDGFDFERHKPND